MILYVGNFLESQGKTPGPNVALVEKLRAHGRVVCASSRRNQLARLCDMLWTVWRYRRETTVVLIDVFSSSAFWFAWATALLCRRLDVPYVAILHGGNLPERLDQSSARCRDLFGGAATLVSPSRYLQDRFEAAGYRVRYIPNFIDIEAYPFVARAACRPRLLWVRSFHHIYNPLQAVEVLAELRKTHADAVLCMVGPDKDGSLERVRQRAHELAVGDRLLTPGRLDRNAWIAMAAGFDIFINTTDVDNQPVSVIEAMALGLPVVSTNVGGLPYLIADGEEGRLVPPRDAVAMAAAVRALIADAALASGLASAARHKVEAFDWVRVKDQWLDVFRDIRAGAA